MKHGTKPTRKQKGIIVSAGLKPENWLVERETEVFLRIIDKWSGETTDIQKSGDTN